MKQIFLLAATLLVSWTNVLMANHGVAPAKPTEVPRETTPVMLTTTTTAKAVYVFDGDTIEIAGGARVRYIGINTPELSHDGKPAECFAREAADENKRLVLGQTVRLVKDVSNADRYGRLLRYVYLGNKMVNDSLVKTGFARAEPIAPDEQFAKMFFLEETAAKSKRIGLWGHCPVDSRGGN